MQSIARPGELRNLYVCTRRSSWQCCQNMSALPERGPAARSCKVNTGQGRGVLSLHVQNRQRAFACRRLELTILPSELQSADLVEVAATLTLQQRLVRALAARSAPSCRPSRPPAAPSADGSARPRSSALPSATSDRTSPSRHGFSAPFRVLSRARSTEPRSRERTGAVRKVRGNAACRDLSPTSRGSFQAAVPQAPSLTAAAGLWLVVSTRPQASAAARCASRWGRSGSILQRSSGQSVCAPLPRHKILIPPHPNAAAPPLRAHDVHATANAQPHLGCPQDHREARRRAHRRRGGCAFRSRLCNLPRPPAHACSRRQGGACFSPLLRAAWRRAGVSR